MPKTRQHLFDHLMAQTIDLLATKDALHKIGLLIDLSGDLKRADGTARAFQWIKAILPRKLRPSQRALIEYFRANAWNNRQIARPRSRPSAWAWEQPEVQNQILHLRWALTHSGFEKLSALRCCQIMTNLANQFSTVGRFVEALELWNSALAINPRFGMALGNRGCGLRFYAQSLYDPGHQRVLLGFAHASLTAAVSPGAQYKGGGYEGAKGFFAASRKHIESFMDVGRVMGTVDLDGHDMGPSEQEQSYRRWCLQHRLFLNPLNDLGGHAIAAQDILTLPNYSTGIEEPPTFSGFFNQMKQEFASARWFLYEAVHGHEVHFSDHRVALYNTLDFPSYALAVERLKAAFGIAYSLFDKTAVFLNAYMKLGIDEQKIYFRSIWYKNQDARQRILRPEFEAYENWPLRGLYWLSKDLFELGFRDVMQPDAQALYDIRNRIQHGYLKVHEMLPPPSKRGRLSRSLWTDRLAYIRYSVWKWRPRRCAYSSWRALRSLISPLECTVRSNAAAMRKRAGASLHR